MNRNLGLIPVVGLCMAMAGLSSCFHDNDGDKKDYSEWREENTKFIESAAIETVNGKLKYEKIIPIWDKSVYALMHWYNERPTKPGLSPISNSTVDVRYVLTDIKGDTLDSNSSFRCRPIDMVTGFQIALTNMETGDSVTAIMPYTAGYGEYSYGSVLPYSTLIFTIKLDSIVAYQSVPWRN